MHIRSIRNLLFIVTQHFTDHRHDTNKGLSLFGRGSYSLKEEHKRTATCYSSAPSYLKHFKNWYCSRCYFLKKQLTYPLQISLQHLNFLRIFCCNQKSIEEAKGPLTWKSVTERRNEQTSFPSSNPFPNLTYTASLRPKGLSGYPHFPRVFYPCMPTAFLLLKEKVHLLHKQVKSSVDCLLNFNWKGAT